ncbi:MAG: hypothetical protein Q4G22_06615 [Paracoccus sp. (in: a-proteobacteria)]|uniref:hypothetical protein n=1 Tax=Paracoccus sp. TaxID=267 RepID=UPI0026DFDF5F|nr:hypothetical protein [Paracoccus sp. (in: a-proteobacteria)]MDO5631493.1 hypothetical protein [Paracoccus sp. (in: a-proteobacteria)]
MTAAASLSEQTLSGDGVLNAIVLHQRDERDVLEEIGHRGGRLAQPEDFSTDGPPLRTMLDDRVLLTQRSSNLRGGPLAWLVAEGSLSLSLFPSGISSLFGADIRVTAHNNVMYHPVNVTRDPRASEIMSDLMTQPMMPVDRLMLLWAKLTGWHPMAPLPGQPHILTPEPTAAPRIGGWLSHIAGRHSRASGADPFADSPILTTRPWWRFW